MRGVAYAALALLVSCSRPALGPVVPEGAADPTPVVLALSDSILAAAGRRDAQRFAAYFSDGPGFRYLINSRQFESRAAVFTAFETMLKRQEIFRPEWQDRVVRVLSPTSAVLTGTFATTARRLNGEEWSASGVVTFVAVREPDGWRVVNWHTSE